MVLLLLAGNSIFSLIGKLPGRIKLLLFMRLNMLFVLGVLLLLLVSKPLLDV